MKIALAQISSVLGDLEKNIEKHVEYCSKAIADGANVIVFPELSLTGYSLKDLNFAIAVNPFKTDKFNALLETSKKISIVCGFAELNDEFGIYNSALYIEDGMIKNVHQKVYPPTYGLFEEFRYFSRGRDCKAFETKYGKSGVLICEDLWHMSLPYLLALDEAKIIYGIAASPTRLGTDTDTFRNYEINSEQHKVFARLLSIYVVFVNRVGFEDGINFWGGSEIVDPFGNVLCKAKIFEEDMIYGDIDLEEVKRARHQARHFLDEDSDLTLKMLQRIYNK
ncbi:MAG TPA: nitrilase-related carbon-nitrogen hydrolase [Ignavibacteria bacterium]|jgi:predicted amidohydrolase|nr:nitrilase-related carbon-nitrogen hydrolase [Ignavibacteria bacterium]